MGRPKKNQSVKPEEPKAPKATEEPLKLLAWFYGRDEDGDKTKMKFESEGQNLEEVINNLVFPKGINALVNLKVSRGDKSAEVALAPQDARYILEQKDWKVLGESFRKL